MRLTGEQIRVRGLAALKRELGRAGLVRFLQQFDRGSGDWAKERRNWLADMTMDEIRTAAAKLLRRKRRAG
jgi:hypothetical protein